MSRQRSFVNLNQPSRVSGVGGGWSSSSAAAAAGSASRPLASLFAPSSSSRWAAEDMRDYLTGYPGQSQNTRACKNLYFYQNRIPSSPSPSGTIDTIHRRWWGDYDLLEQHHGYIQFLFPIRENGMNSHAQMLYLHERAGIRADPQARRRVLTSYRLMLDFYGMRLVDERTGELARQEHNFQQRYHHLNRSTHNYLRITRILKCLGELGFERLKLGFLLHILREITEGALSTRSVGKSARDYWFPVLRTPSDKAALQQVIKQLQKEESESDTAVVLTADRIRDVLQTAIQSRQQLADQDEDADAAEVAPTADTHPTNTEPLGDATGSATPSSQLSDPEEEFDDDDDDDGSVDSPRAEAEAMVPSRASSAASSLSRTHTADLPVAAGAAAVSPAASSPSPSSTDVTGKRSGTSAELSESTRETKIAAAAAAAATDSQAQPKMQSFFAKK